MHGGPQSFQQKKHRDAAAVQAAFEQNIEQELAALAAAPSYDVEVGGVTAVLAVLTTDGIGDTCSARASVHALAQTLGAPGAAPGAAQQLQPLNQPYPLAPGEATFEQLMGSLAAAPALPIAGAHAPSLAELLASSQGSDTDYDEDAPYMAGDASAAPLAQPLSSLQSNRKFAAAFGCASPAPCNPQSATPESALEGPCMHAQPSGTGTERRRR